MTKPDFRAPWEGDRGSCFHSPRFTPCPLLSQDGRSAALAMMDLIASRGKTYVCRLLDTTAVR
jgi:hypothetical protein